MRQPRLVAAAELKPGSTIGDFQVQRLIGEGTQGRVYLAQDLTLGRRVALKILKATSPESERRLIDEARTTARFSHPHIVTIFQADVWEGQPYLALEYLEGESLRDWLGHGPLALVEALRLVQAIAEALAEAHRHGIVHADLKPENVVVTRGGGLKVVDFGLSRLVGDGNGGGSGTPAYAAPERFEAPAPSGAMDVWALGVVLFELCTGRRPFDHPERSVGVGWPLGVLALPSAATLTAMLAFSPEQRPTAGDVAEALRRAIDASAKRTGHDAPPFRGLRAFGEDDAVDFTGREGELDEALERLHRLRRLLVVGPSGIGKSSFLGAALMPRLTAAGAPLARVRPGREPLSRLALALGDAPDAARERARRWQTTPATLLELVLARGEALVLVVDQLEELFTVTSPPERAAFLACLELLHDTAACRLVLAVRQDFLGELMGALAGRFSDSLLALQPLGGPALERAVIAPLRRVGYDVDDRALIEALVKDVEGRSAALPLLQFTCQALWDTRDDAGRTLRLASYRAMGGAAGALADRADRLLDELSPGQVETARALLVRLVTASETRRPLRFEALVEGLADGRALVEQLITGRLLEASSEPGEPPLVELTHEALITQWPRLRRWLDESRDGRAFRDEVEQAAALWALRGRPPSETWVGPALAQAQARRARFEGPLSDEAERFLDESAQRERSLRRRRVRSRTAVMGALAVVALGGVSAAAVTRAQQEEIRLAAGNLGTFTLQLQPFRWEADGGARWLPAGDARGLSFQLGASAKGWRDTAPPVFSALRFSATALDAGLWRVEAPGGPATLTVLREGAEPCEPIELRLAALPGYEERAGPARQLSVPVPTCDATRADMVSISAGPVVAAEPDGGLIEVDAFAIDRLEVSAAHFAFFEALAPLTGLERAPELAVLSQAGVDLPAHGVTALQADAFCRFLGKRLPSADEWLKAARGGVRLDEGPNPWPARPLPWGLDDGTRRANVAGLEGADVFMRLAPRGAMAGDVSPSGVVDLAGNVAEWTSSTSTEAGLRGLAVLLGASWDMPAHRQSLALKNTRPPQAVQFDIGFRCAASRR
ncbi:MAG: bifunctional serine/threonine-protein kinase/formylglycine-generating enzyme family protein [Myxococcaceae bacterium]|nr:bifunctional serine/threonine-protein kinase/formylglycine-generating enzyme family protein [Myxococcaceae bacterium]